MKPQASDPASGKFAGLAVDLAGLGHVRLSHALSQNAETSLYRTEHPGVVVKLFDLSCGKPDEVGYGPYMGFRSELANFEEIRAVEELGLFVPFYYGAHIDYTRKFAFIAMEYIEGENLRAWSERMAHTAFEDDALDGFRRAAFEVLSIMALFHKHGFVLIDFKPENIMYQPDGTIKLVDLGSFFTPRHRRDRQSFVYSATPDHSEVLIDASNLQAGVSPTEASDVFSAGVALFEMATATSRLLVDGGTATEMAQTPSFFLFRDSQIKDVWRAFPHLREQLPLVHNQLRDCRILFSEVWHLLKAYLARKVDGWDGLDPGQQDQILMATGTTFIMEQLPLRLSWLAGPIAQATALRNHRVKGVADLVALLANPASPQAIEDLRASNCLIRYLQSLDLPVDFAERLNSWEVHLDRSTNHWTIAAPSAFRQLSDTSRFVFLKRGRVDPYGQTFYHVVDEFDADKIEERRLTLWHVGNEHSAWLGTAMPAAG